MFLQDDIYTSSGSLKLYHCWTDKVTKFDSSSFYNWEQDDLPIFDLEERTHYLWEKLGYPTSSIPGVALVVSADASDSDTACNKNIFRTVSAAINALPDVINFPVIIEIANFGELGDLVLNNYKFGPRGSLEIINRNFTRVPGKLANATTVNTGNADTASPLSNYVYVSGLTPSLIGGSKYYGARQGFIQASCLSISAAVFSGIRDSRLSGIGTLSPKLNGVCKVPSNRYSHKVTTFIGSQNGIQPFNSDTYTIDFKAYDYGADANETIGSYDASTFNMDNTQFIHTEGITYFNGLFYGNKLNKIIVTNCDGPIYLRNFFLDGSGYRYNNEYGVEVNNSSKVYLENIVATRFRKAGLVFNNSKVTLLRGCVATRNYNFDSANTRLTGPWSSRIKNPVYNIAKGYLTEDDGAGLLANNSVVTVSSTSSLEANCIYNRIVTIDGVAGINKSDINPHVNYIFDFSKNSNGIVLNNSTFNGGYSIDEFTSPIQDSIISIASQNNTGFGIKCVNSNISYSGRIFAVENLHGILLDSTIFESDRLEIIGNQLNGIVANNSILKYNKNLNYDREAAGITPIRFKKNGRHLNLDNSKMLPVYTSAMDEKYKNSHDFLNPIGKLADGRISPSIYLNNNSEAVIMSPKIFRTTSEIVAGSSCYGSEIFANNNSKANIKGTQYYATRILGPGNDANGTTVDSVAALYANNNSTIEINGPTVIAQHAIDLLAENNSIINIRPHTHRESNELDISAFSLDNKLNHTAVELHSNRSCIVINKNSILNINNLGSYVNSWNRTADGSTIVSYSGTDLPLNEKYVSAGSIQFYPNTGSYNYNFPTGAGTDNFTYNTGRNLLYYSTQGVSPATPVNFSSVTVGGMCVRALNQSIVNVHNVNFPCGWWVPSGIYYDNGFTTQSTLCNALFIWNITDNSKLNASYLSVSSMFPKDTGYFGPSGNWCSGANCNSYASGLPISTPDTSSLSVLDYFGKSTVNPYGKSTQQNYGPFRLYFGVNPVVNTLTDPSSNGYNVIPQIYSQGYQPSSSLIASSAYVSAIYPMVLQRNSSNNIVPSGYYYGSGIMHNSEFINVMLDQSAAETFANAKHCAVGKSGNAKLVSIYLPYQNPSEGDSRSKQGIKSINTFDLERNS